MLGLRFGLRGLTLSPNLKPGVKHAQALDIYIEREISKERDNKRTKQALAARGRLAAAVATARPSPKLSARTQTRTKWILTATPAGMVGSRKG